MNSPINVDGYAFSALEPPRRITVPITDTIQRLMDISFEQAMIALDEGGTPVGAALVDMESGQEWFGRSDDTVSGDLQSHAEIKCYRKARPLVRDRLGKCALVSTTELCSMCTATFAQGDISTILVAAPRKALIREDGTPILRARKIGMFDLLADSAAHSNAYSGYRADESVALWQQWDNRRRAI